MLYWKSQALLRCYKEKEDEREQEERRDKGGKVVCSEFQKLKYQRPILEDQLTVEIYSMNPRFEETQK